MKILVSLQKGFGDWSRWKIKNVKSTDEFNALDVTVKQQAGETLRQIYDDY